MESGTLIKEKNEIEQNTKSIEKEDQAELEIDEQINTLASVLIEILLKDHELKPLL